MLVSATLKLGTCDARGDETVGECLRVLVPDSHNIGYIRSRGAVEKNKMSRSDSRERNYVGNGRELS